MEYWLQKSGLGRWSMVTWYSDLEQAKANFQQCVGNGLSGYSWRLCKVEAVEVVMLDEVTEIEAPSLEPEPAIAAVKSGWGNFGSGTRPLDLKPVNPVWGEKRTSVNPGLNTGLSRGWGDMPSASQSEHGLSGSVWLVHHEQKAKVRVRANEVDRYISEGYERGGPKTKFRE